MDIDTLSKIIDYAKEARIERRRLERLHAGHVARTNSGGMSRARTTTYNAAASHAAERARSFEKDLRDLVVGQG